ncbi:MAG TPA: NAD(P)-binding domain-containing protein [Xanthomonadales bacterium]|nr:NAD(P)-binding domain-containing protein [Xanthomonadales bacterium]
MIRPAAESATGAVDVIVIGAGHSGLAMSHCLTELAVEHVVIERGSVANSWRHERWDSLRLLTPNWQRRLPGQNYDGTDPDGYLAMPELIQFMDRYAGRMSAPLFTDTLVTVVRPEAGGYRVETDRGNWWCRAVVMATGANNRQSIPACASAIPSELVQATTLAYRNPDQLPDGGVLVVGASASGLQLAEEIHRSGRPVTLAVGEHVRLPRHYRGKDIQWWMEAVGVLDERYDQVDDLGRVRHVPSPQLIGTPQHRTLDLNSLTAQGIRLVGRLANIRDGRAQFSGSLRNVCDLADLKMNRLLDRVDQWIESTGYECVAGPQRFEPTRTPAQSCLAMNLAGGEVRSVVWATGLHPDYSWLDVPVLDRKGMIRHDGGVVEAPGLYVLGLPFLRRRKSTFIHGAEDDVRDLAQHLQAWLGTAAAGFHPLRVAV